MIGAFAKSSTQVVKQFTFSTLRADKNYGNSFNRQQNQMSRDVEKIFQQFYVQNPPNQHQRSLFDHNYNLSKETFELDPYETLGVKADASKEQIKQAYRQLVMKYHPKKDSSFEAGEKFIKISRAYQMINQQKSQNRKQKSLLNHFQNNMRQLLSSQAGIQTKQMMTNDKEKIKTAQLYSQTSKIKKIGDKKKVTIQKEYNKNGKLIKFIRTQEINSDGSVNVTQTLDDGDQVKVNNFVQPESNNLKESQNKQTKDKELNVELYSQATRIKKVGDKKQITIEKEYNNNGKLIKLIRAQQIKQDGTAKVSQIYDDGVDIKTNSFIQSS